MQPVNPSNPAKTSEWIESIRFELRAYCLSLSRHAWETDDLVQDTILRLLRVMEREPGKAISRTYVYRVARNLWIDRCRKRTRTDMLLPDDALHELAAYSDSAIDTREMLDSIARLLKPKAVVVLLLMDVFGFTAKETAHMIASTEGAVQVALSRARSRLRALADTVRGEGPKAVGTPPDPVWFDAILNGFHNRSPKAIYEAYLRLCEGGIRIRDLRSTGGRLFFTFQDPDGNILMVST